MEEIANRAGLRRKTAAPVGQISGALWRLGPPAGRCAASLPREREREITWKARCLAARYYIDNVCSHPSRQCKLLAVYNLGKFSLPPQTKLLSKDQLNCVTQRSDSKPRHRYNLDTDTVSTPIQSRHRYSLDTDTISTPIQSRHRYNLDTDTVSPPIQSHHRYSLETDTVSTPIQSRHRYNLDTDTVSPPIQSRHRHSLDTDTVSTPIQSRHRFSLDTDTVAISLDSTYFSIVRMFHLTFLRKIYERREDLS